MTYNKRKTCGGKKDFPDYSTSNTDYSTSGTDYSTNSSSSYDLDLNSSYEPEENKGFFSKITGLFSGGKRHRSKKRSSKKQSLKKRSSKKRSSKKRRHSSKKRHSRK